MIYPNKTMNFMIPEEIENGGDVDTNLLKEYDEIPVYEVDPSVAYLFSIMKPKGSEDAFILLDDVDEDDKKILVKKKISLPVRKDYRKNVKLYLTEETVAYMQRLKTSTIKLLCYIMENVEEYGNRVNIVPNLVSKDIDMHFTTVYNSRLSLLKDKWIYKTDTKDRFTINLLRFSKGDIPHILNRYDRAEQRKRLQEEVDKQIEERKNVDHV